MVDISKVDLAAMGTITRPFSNTFPAFDHKSLLPPNMAKLAVKAVYEEIADFEKSLDEDHELGMPIVGGLSGLCVHVREIYRYGNDKLVFSGLDSSGNPVRLMQHLSQLNLLMLAAPKLEEIANRTGFHEPDM